MPRDEYQGSQPSTFPGAGWYAPDISMSGSAETLPMSDEDMYQAHVREQQRGPFGFARVLEDWQP